MVKIHQINATCDPNNPNMKQDFTRFCTYRKKYGPQSQILLVIEKNASSTERNLFSNLPESIKIAK